MAEVTIQKIDEPSKSKKGGPCWLAIATSENSGLTFANDEPETVEADQGQTITVVGKAKLKKWSGEIDNHGTKKRLVVTGNPDDSVIVTVGGGQWVKAEVTGVQEKG